MDGEIRPRTDADAPLDIADYFPPGYITDLKGAAKTAQLEAARPPETGVGISQIIIEAPQHGETDPATFQPHERITLPVEERALIQIGALDVT